MHARVNVNTCLWFSTKQHVKCLDCVYAKLHNRVHGLCIVTGWNRYLYCTLYQWHLIVVQYDCNGFAHWNTDVIKYSIMWHEKYAGIRIQPMRLPPVIDSSRQTFFLVWILVIRAPQKLTFVEYQDLRTFNFQTKVSFRVNAYTYDHEVDHILIVYVFL